MKQLFAALAVLVVACHNGNNNQRFAFSSNIMAVQEIVASGTGDTLNTEQYNRIVENPFFSAYAMPVSTFSIDVDKAAYSNVRRFLNSGQLPPTDAVRIEELINYFSYDFKPPLDGLPFRVYTETGECPWNPAHRLVQISIQGKKLETANLPPSNLVFLVDVSGSMGSHDKLPLVQSSLELLTDQLREQDRISIVVYAGQAGLVLPSTPGSEKVLIKAAINRLEAGGSTAGGEGIQLAYKVARENFIAGGNNRVILATDGDFNVGIRSESGLVSLIEEERNSGVYLSVLGFGTGNYQEGKMQELADRGNGNHFYIDQLNEAKKVLVNEFSGTLFTIAKDVKIQVAFNPAKVAGYRLLGYENRLLENRDFEDDKKDAGELGSGHSVIAFYEIIPAGVDDEFTRRFPAEVHRAIPASSSNELMSVRLRYKNPDSDESRLIESTILDAGGPFATRTENFRFAAAVAEFGLLLRNSEFRQNSSWEQVLNHASGAKGRDADGYRDEFIKLAGIAFSLQGKN